MPKAWRARAARFGGLGVGFQATTIAQATQLYPRYDGEIATGTDNHSVNLGARFTW
jgi:hypothetical protein